jgi:hypothetical protein
VSCVCVCALLCVSTPPQVTAAGLVKFIEATPVLQQLDVLMHESGPGGTAVTFDTCFALAAQCPCLKVSTWLSFYCYQVCLQPQTAASMHWLLWSLSSADAGMMLVSSEIMRLIALCVQRCAVMVLSGSWHAPSRHQHYQIDAAIRCCMAPCRCCD